MKKDRYGQKIDEGFDENKFGNFMSIQLLLHLAAEHYNQEAIEYCKQFGLCTMNNKMALNGLNKQIIKVANTIAPSIKKGLENKLNLMDDFDEFIKLVDKFKIYPDKK